MQYYICSSTCHPKKSYYRTSLIIVQRFLSVRVSIRASTYTRVQTGNRKKVLCCCAASLLRLQLPIVSYSTIWLVARHWLVVRHSLLKSNLLMPEGLTECHRKSKSDHMKLGAIIIHILFCVALTECYLVLGLPEIYQRCHPCGKYSSCLFPLSLLLFSFNVFPSPSLSPPSLSFPFSSLPFLLFPLLFPLPI